MTTSLSLYKRLCSLTKYFTLVFFLFLPTIGLSYEELESIEGLPPTPGPDYRDIGWEWHFIDQDGKSGFMKKMSDTQKTASYIRSDGCTWTRWKAGFAPATSWKDCPSNGKSEYHFFGDDIWPLKVGAEFGYKGEISGSLLNQRRNFTRKCIVKEQIRIRTIAGDFDTSKVICKEKWVVRTWWLSPIVGTAVVYEQKNFMGDLVVHEMVKIVSP